MVVLGGLERSWAAVVAVGRSRGSPCARAMGDSGKAPRLGWGGGRTMLGLPPHAVGRAGGGRGLEGLGCAVVGCSRSARIGGPFCCACLRGERSCSLGVWWRAVHRGGRPCFCSVRAKAGVLLRCARGGGV